MTTFVDIHALLFPNKWAKYILMACGLTIVLLKNIA